AGPEYSPGSPIVSSTFPDRSSQVSCVIFDVSVTAPLPGPFVAWVAGFSSCFAHGLQLSQAPPAKRTSTAMTAAIQTIELVCHGGVCTPTFSAALICCVAYEFANSRSANPRSAAD